MNALTIASRYTPVHLRSVGYWLATVPVVAELGRRIGRDVTGAVAPQRKR